MNEDMDIVYSEKQLQKIGEKLSVLCHKFLHQLFQPQPDSFFEFFFSQRTKHNLKQTYT